ncbi:MAG: 16S rRNA (cytosine(1402)-N(4))-methyltransferase RsmH [Pseudomonadota bacterium]
MSTDAAAGTSSPNDHEAVLLEPVLRALLPDDRPRPRRVLDGTFGRGGHSRALLARLPDDAVLYVIDRDPEAVAVARQLAAEDARVRVLPGCFAELDSLLGNALGAVPEGVLDALLLDFGVSSPQLDTPERGFSLRFDGPLDMRMDPAVGPSAGQWLDAVEEAELTQVLRRFGEVRPAPRIARAIIAARPLTTTLELAEVIAAATPAAVRRQRGRLHLVTQCFQAIRIFINDELKQIETVLPKAFAALAPTGRLAVISFHSLEDRMVKQFFRAQTRTPAVPRRLPVAADRLPQAPARLIGRAQRADAAEVEANPRARSATLRVLERCA